MSFCITTPHNLVDGYCSGATYYSHCIAFLKPYNGVLGMHSTLTRDWISKNYAAQFNTAISPCRTLHNNHKYTTTGTDIQGCCFTGYTYNVAPHTQLSFTLRVEEPGSPESTCGTTSHNIPEDHKLNTVLSASNMSINRNLTFNWWIIHYLEKRLEVNIHTASHVSLLVGDITVSASARRRSNNLTQKFSRIISVYVCPLISGEFFGMASKAQL